MTLRKTHRLGNLQLRILQVLWQRGPSFVAEVHEALGQDLDLAYTTVATMLRKMEARGLVRHAAQGRRFVYRAAVSEDRVAREMTADLVDRLFSGSLADMVSHLLQARDVSEDELDELERLIAARKKRS